MSTNLVVFDMPSSSIIVLLFPVFVLGDGEEREVLLTLTDLDNRGDEFDKEARNLKQTREEMV
jgi:hypothetical protein